MLRVTEEVGLKPSTVLMFDRLIFVEGPSDEAILSELARVVSLDPTSTNATFVQMGGSYNLNQFAAEATLDLLSRRRVDMFFVLDRDERDAAEIAKIVKRMGDRAVLKTLKKRELENYLLVPKAVHGAIAERARSAGADFNATVHEVDNTLRRKAEGALDRLLHLLVMKRLCGPVFPNQLEGSAEHRLRSALEKIGERLREVAEIEKNVRSEVEKDWPASAMQSVPGSYILEETFSEYNLKYKKDSDGRRIAARIGKTDIDSELLAILRETLSVDINT